MKMEMLQPSGSFKSRCVNDSPGYNHIVILTVLLEVWVITVSKRLRSIKRRGLRLASSSISRAEAMPGMHDDSLSIRFFHSV